MAMACERECPICGQRREFYRAASTTLHLGTKTKWRCVECAFGVVTIDGVVDTGA